MLGVHIEVAQLIKAVNVITISVRSLTWVRRSVDHMFLVIMLLLPEELGM